MTALSPRDRALVSLMLDAGLRVSEAVGLPWANVRQGTGEIVVVRGKGQRDRVVPCTWPMLRDLQAGRHHGTPWVCWSLTRPAHHITRSRAAQICTALGQQVGLPGLHPHQLRHTYATGLLRAGLDLLDIQALLGHSDLATTAIYLHVERSALGQRLRSALLPEAQLDILPLLAGGDTR